jgi:TPR repeat protein
MQRRCAVPPGAVLLLAVIARGDTEEGFKRLVDGDYAAARKEFQAAAEKGNAEAQFQLGEIHRQGLGVEASPDRAATWYQKPAEQGHGGAAGELGLVLWRQKKRERAIGLIRTHPCGSAI